MSKTKNICFFVDYMVFPPSDGGQKAKYYRILESAKYYNVTILTSKHSKNNNYHTEPTFIELRNACTEILFFDRVCREFKGSGILNKLLILLRWLMSRKTYNEFIYSSGKNKKQIEEYFSNNEPDIFIAETIYYSDLVSSEFLNNRNIPILVTLHNVDSIFF